MLTGVYSKRDINYDQVVGSILILPLWIENFFPNDSSSQHFTGQKFCRKNMIIYFSPQFFFF